MPRKLSVARAARGIISMEFCEDAALNLMAQVDVSVLGSGREQQEQKAHNVTATMDYIVDFVQEQWDARPSEAVVLRFHRMLTYSVPYRHNIRGRYRVRRGRRLYLLPPDGDQARRLMAEFARWFSEGPPARRDPVIVTHYHVRRGVLGRPLPPRGHPEAFIPRDGKCPNQAAPYSAPTSG